MADTPVEAAPQLPPPAIAPAGLIGAGQIDPGVLTGDEAWLANLANDLSDGLNRDTQIIADNLQLPEAPEMPTPETEPPSTTPEGPTPTLDWSTIRQHPEFQKALDTEIQARVPGTVRQLQAERERQQGEEAARAELAQRENEWRETVALANEADDPYDDEHQGRIGEARRRVAQVNYAELERQRLADELAPEIRQTIAQAEIAQYESALLGQYEAGLDAIPELKAAPGLRAQVHPSRFRTYAEWFAALVDAISEHRIVARAEPLARELAETRTAEEMARYRSTLPNPDLGVRRATPTGTAAIRSRVEADQALIAGRIDIDEFRTIVSNPKLPYTLGT